MRSYGFLFVAACMALIAASVGAVLRFAAGLSTVEAALVALPVLFVLMTLEVVASRVRDRAEFTARLEGLARASAEIAREVGELRHRAAALEASPAAETKTATQPLAREIGQLAHLVEELAQSVAVHDALLAAPGPEPAPPPAPAAPAAVPESKAATPAIPTGPFAGRSEEEVKSLVREAVEAGRIDIYLQPVVTLPQRKVRYYEALSRMRLAEGTVIEAAHFLAPARAAGLLPKIDEHLVHNSVQVVRRLAAKNREAGLFINIASETLNDRAVFKEVFGYLDANRALAPSLILELPQGMYRSLGPAERESLSRLAERGYRFSLDRIQDFRIDPRGLAEQGVRFVKVPAELMLKRVHDGDAQIHPADLADLLARFGIDLVADHIESETIVVDLLDFDVRYGQGFLFAPPRPVRSDVLSSERAAAPAGAATAASPMEPDPAAATPRAPASDDLGRNVRRA